MPRPSLRFSILLAVALALGASLAGAAVHPAPRAEHDGMIHACAKLKDGKLRTVPAGTHCFLRERARCRGTSRDRRASRPAGSAGPASAPGRGARRRTRSNRRPGAGRARRARGGRRRPAERRRPGGTPARQARRARRDRRGRRARRAAGRQGRPRRRVASIDDLEGLAHGRRPDRHRHRRLRLEPVVLTCVARGGGGGGTRRRSPRQRGDDRKRRRRATSSSRSSTRARRRSRRRLEGRLPLGRRIGTPARDGPGRHDPRARRFLPPRRRRLLGGAAPDQSFSTGLAAPAAGSAFATRPGALDSVGWGAAANGLSEGAPAAPPAGGSSESAYPTGTTPATTPLTSPSRPPRPRERPTSTADLRPAPSAAARANGRPAACAAPGAQRHFLRAAPQNADLADEPAQAAPDRRRASCHRRRAGPRRLRQRRPGRRGRGNVVRVARRARPPPCAALPGRVRRGALPGQVVEAAGRLHRRRACGGSRGRRRAHADARLLDGRRGGDLGCDEPRSRACSGSRRGSPTGFRSSHYAGSGSTSSTAR